MPRFAFRMISRQTGNSQSGSLFPPPPGPNPLAHAVRLGEDEGTGTEQVPAAVTANSQGRGAESLGEDG
jgi:hypothetical protein